MTLFSKAWERLDDILFGRRKRFIMALDNVSSELRGINRNLLDTNYLLRATLEKTTENLSAATQVLVRAMGAFERSDMAFAEIGSMADKMKGREAALEEALISIGKLKVEEAKVKALEAEELKLNLAAKPYDDKF